MLNHLKKKIDEDNKNIEVCKKILDLIENIKNNRYEEIKNLLTNESNKNVIFVLVCYYGNLNMMKNFYYYNSDINLSYGNELSFRLCCQINSLEKVKWLLETKPNINVSVKNNLPLISSIQKDDDSLFFYLLDKCNLKHLFVDYNLTYTEETYTLSHKILSRIIDVDNVKIFDFMYNEYVIKNKDNKIKNFIFSTKHNYFCRLLSSCFMTKIIHNFSINIIRYLLDNDILKYISKYTTNYHMLSSYLYMEKYIFKNCKYHSTDENLLLLKIMILAHENRIILFKKDYDSVYLCLNGVQKLFDVLIYNYPDLNLIKYMYKNYNINIRANNDINFIVVCCYDLKDVMDYFCSKVKEYSYKYDEKKQCYIYIVGNDEFTKDDMTEEMKSDVYSVSKKIVASPDFIFGNNNYYKEECAKEINKNNEMIEVFNNDINKSNEDLASINNKQHVNNKYKEYLNKINRERTDANYDSIKYIENNTKEIERSLVEKKIKKKLNKLNIDSTRKKINSDVYIDYSYCLLCDNKHNNFDGEECKNHNVITISRRHGMVVNV